MANSIYARYTDNIFSGATFTPSVAPMASYDAASLGAHRFPESRVRWDVHSVDIDIDLSAPAQGDILVLPVTNLPAGFSPTVITLTNDSGLSQQLTVPELPINRIPLTLVCDLTVDTPLDATRLEDGWHLSIVNAGVDITLGPIYLFGPKRELTPNDVNWGFTEHLKHAASNQANEYLTRYRQDYETQERSRDCVVRATYAQKELLKSFYHANAGLVEPGLLWPEPTIIDAYIGTWQEVFSAQQVNGAGTPFTDDYYDVTLQFTELSKGKPI